MTAISDRQFDLLEDRSAAAGVDRRDFLKIAAALAALGAPASMPGQRRGAPTLAPGEKLAKDQTLPLGGAAGGRTTRRATTTTRTCTARGCRRCGPVS